MTFSDQLIDQLMENYQTPEDLVGENGILKELTKRLLERALAGEMNDHLGYAKHALEGRNSGNSRNGHFNKTIKGDFGELDINVPRDRNGEFRPQILPKGQTRFSGFDDKIISLYARGLSTREITAHLQEIYGVELSPGLISNVTQEVMADVNEWQNRELDPIYPIVYFDAMRVKVRANGHIVNKSVCLAMGVNLDGYKDLLGMWVVENESAQFWLTILTELNNRGLQDLFIACVDGLIGFPDAIQAVFPDAKVQLCIVHMIRNSLKLVSHRDRKQLCADLKHIYSASTLSLAESNLQRFADLWDAKYPQISLAWHKHWPNLTTFFDYPEDIRKVLYTTNPMESFNRSLRKVSKTRGVFPSDNSVRKLFFLAFRNASLKWTRPVQNWIGALNRFYIQFPTRLPSL